MSRLFVTVRGATPNRRVKQLLYSARDPTRVLCRMWRNHANTERAEGVKRASMFLVRLREAARTVKITTKGQTRVPLLGRDGTTV